MSSLSSKQAHGNGRKYEPFASGDFLILSGDPRQCYIIGRRFPKGQVIETLAAGGWAMGTRFKTEVGGQTIEYEVYGRTMMKVNSQSN